MSYKELEDFCGPVVLYEMLKTRTSERPSFLQRCLSYKIDARRRRRIQMTISLSGNVNPELLPLHVMLARYDSSTAAGRKHNPAYSISQRRLITGSNNSERMDKTKATIILQDIDVLSAQNGRYKHTILLVNSVLLIWGEIPIEPFLSIWKESEKLDSDVGCTLEESVDMRYSCIKWNWGSCRHISCRHISFLNKDNWQITHKLDVMVSAKEIGPKETSPYTDYVLDDSLLSSLPPYIKRLRAGNVLFNYKKYNTILAYEGTADFLCPFCLVMCASFKGLTFHLWACHDYFKFEFTVTEQYQIVNVFVDIKKWKDKIFEDPRAQTFLWLKPQRRITCQNVKDFHSIECIFGGNMGEDGYNEVHLGKDASRDFFPMPVTASTLDVDQPVDTSHREIRNDTCVVERAELVKSTANLQAYSRMRASLQKRQLFHSQGVQLMDIEEVLQDKDSEDEIDEDIANFEDRMRLDNRVGPSYLTEYEKRFMHLWNSFTRRHKVFADAHIPWACEQFLRQHGDVIIGSLQLTWCWRLFTVKLWNLGLIDGNMMDRYTSICQDIQRRLGCM